MKFLGLTAKKVLQRKIGRITEAECIAAVVLLKFSNDKSHFV